MRFAIALWIIDGKSRLSAKARIFEREKCEIGVNQFQEYHSVPSWNVKFATIWHRLS